MGKQKKIRGNQFGVSGFESLQGQTCKCSSESERGQNRDCYQSLEPVREAVTQWALGLPLLALFKSFCSVLTVTIPCMQTPAERWVISTGFDQEMKCQWPCFLSYIRTSVFLFNSSKKTLKTHDPPQPEICQRLSVSLLSQSELWWCFALVNFSVCVLAS